LGKLFGSSGVRGLVNVALTPQLACKVGLAVATYSKAKHAVVGCDTRVSGPMLEDALVSGLTSAGTNVSLVGVVPTPSVAFLTRELHADVGFMLTASHNPPQYNGIKVFDGGTLSYTDQHQTEVERIISENAFARADWHNMGEAQVVDASERYVKMLHTAGKLNKKWRIVVDPGCGATYRDAALALNGLGCKTTTINSQPDGHFPARCSEPTENSLIDLSKTVQAIGADLGVGFDGDGDRVAFVDRKGKFVDFDRALAAYSAYALKNAGGGTVVTNVEASMCVETMAEKYGGNVIRVRVGDIYVSEAIKQFSAVFGGEPCGAWVHPKFHWCPDGPLSSILLLKALEDENLNLKEFVAQVPEYVTVRENIVCKNEQKRKIVSEVEKTIIQVIPEYKDVSNVDGVRLALKNGWLLIRASGTEPLIRLTVEGESLKAAQNIMSKGIAVVKKYTGDA
jgi:phosphoglucosamine mutase